MDLHALHRHGWSISALARKFHLNRRTVRRELAAGAPPGWPRWRGVGMTTPSSVGFG
jgi:lambda repressor-like predicted transcriptional regulator